MSSFNMNARHKKSGELHVIFCIDDYFGKHRYGYIPNIVGGVALNEEDFHKFYTPEEKVEKAAPASKLKSLAGNALLSAEELLLQLRDIDKSGECLLGPEIFDTELLVLKLQRIKETA